MRQKVDVYPVTSKRWKDFERLFGKNGAYDGCWCMWWRLKRSEYSAGRGEGNKRAIKRIIEKGSVPGLIAYVNGQPTGWCSVGPRADFPVLDRSPNLKPVDTQPVWSIVCLFVAKPFRRRGLVPHLIKAAIRYAAAHAANIVEAYPVDRKGSPTPDVSIFTGVPSSFHALGFKEVLRRAPRRPILRYKITRKKGFTTEYTEDTEIIKKF
jgi:GNAT superfamily N-acetyltransferase